MCIGHRRANLLHQFQPFCHGQHALVAEAIERLAFDIFHHEIRQTIIRGTAIQQRRDVWMIQRGKNLSFAAKAAQNEIRVHPTLDDFDGNTFLEQVVGAHRQIHCAHPAASQFAFDFVCANVFALPRGHIVIWIGGVIVNGCEAGE